MSQYEKLDALIVDAIKGGCHSFSAIYNSRSVFDEALRRRGLIVYVTGWGWRVKEEK